MTQSPGASALDRALGVSTRAKRCLGLAGMPGVGKSLILDRAAAQATRDGRRVRLLRWDGARLAFDTPDNLERYPEIDGVTHPVLRRAAGVWARQAVARWHAHAAQDELLLIEAPLLGNRFLELTLRADDDAEELLGSTATQFDVIVPSREVRAVIVAARARDSDDPQTMNARASAAPSLLTAQWAELTAAARQVGVLDARPADEYDPDVYWAVYSRMLSHRHHARLPVDVTLPPDRGARDAPPAPELEPTPGEVAATMSQLAELPVETVIREVDGWADRL